MKKRIYDLFRIPYYYALIARHGEVVARAVISMKNARVRYFTVKGFKTTFILPIEKSPGDIPPLKLKSGRILVYDVKNAFPMKLRNRRPDIIDMMDDESSNTVSAVLPEQFVLTPIDIQELFDFLNAHIVEDIMSDKSIEIPRWLIYLIALAILAIAAVAIVLMATGQSPAAIIPVGTPIPTPTPGYTVVT